ncbi:MAG: demethoxyubiquinone hydroxylase family protein [Planctomycetes bacterium]|nr:demethoxyubiquinone hydroxylase family protein [Planctomycetota bacterium]
MSDDTPHCTEQTIRREMQTRDVRLRAAATTPAQRRAARKTLRTINRLETMAVQVYRAQWSPRLTELNRQLIAAMDNELVHQADSLSRLMEYGGRPMLLRAPFYVVGWVMGRVSRMLGVRAMMRLGAWVEGKAIDHYAHLTVAMEWDPQTHEMLMRMWDDEKCHHSRWTYFLNHPDEALAPPRAEDGR